MADDPTKRGTHDRARINVNEDHELLYWAKKWGVTPTQIREAVNKVGVLTKNVAKKLGRK
jgi:hypothetical protein